MDLAALRESRSFWVLFTPEGIPGWIGDAPRDGAEQVDGLAIDFLAAHRRTAEGDWVKRDPVPPPPPSTAEEIAAQEAARLASEREAAERERKIAGVEFEGVMCSATAEDQAGLAAVLLAIQMQGAAFQPTMFHFENGSRLVIHLGNWQAFAATWLPFRQSFFLVDEEA